jgi:hypothetical protein
MAAKLEMLELLRALLLLRIAVFENNIPNESAGICFNVWFFGDDSLIYPFFKRCKSSSGSIKYPVTGGVSAYGNNENKWIGEYGKCRIKLLDELIMVIEMDLAEGKYA